MFDKSIADTKKKIEELSTELTSKQKKFLWHYFRTGNGTKSALKAYDTKDPLVASVIASQNLIKLKDVVRTYMENAGISLGKLVSVIDKSLDAKKETKSGKMVDDHITQLKAVELAGKWLGGDISSKTSSETAINTQYNFFMISKGERGEINNKYKEWLRNHYDGGEEFSLDESSERGKI